MLSASTNSEPARPSSGSPPPGLGRASLWSGFSRSAPGRLRTLLGLLLQGVLIWLAVRSVDFALFKSVLWTAEHRWLISAVPAVAVCMLAGSLRLWLFLRALPVQGAGVGFGALTSIYLATSAAHNLLPSPAAFVVRTVLLQRGYGYTTGRLVASQLVTAIVDGLCLGILAVAVALSTPLPYALNKAMFLGGAIGAGGVLAFLAVSWLWGRQHRDQLSEPRSDAEPDASAAPAEPGFLRRTARAMHLLRRPSLWLAGLGCSLLVEVANALSIGMAAASVGTSLSFGTCVVLMMIGRLASLAPSTPGQFGVIEAGLVMGFSALGIDTTRALAIAVLYHLVHFIPVTVVGLWELRRQWSRL
jgi:hypothetical protein